MTTNDPTTSQSPSARRLTTEALAEVYSLGGYRAIIDAADGHIAASMLRALAHVSGLAHAAAGYPRHLLSPLRDVLAAVDRLPDAASLAAWVLGEMPAGDVEPRPDGEVERLRAELAQARADALMLAGHWFGARGGFFGMVPGLTDAEEKALTVVAYDADDMSLERMLAVVRRVLGGAR